MVSGNEKLDEVYYEVALDTVSNRNIIVPKSKLSSFIKNGKVVYRSMFGFKNTIIDHFKIYRTVKSFKDTCYIESLVFDLDSHKGNNLLDSLKEGVPLVKDLIKQIAEMTGTSEYSIPIWYSGRGFHLQTPNFFNFKPSNYLRDEVLATMKHYFPYIDHKPYMTTGLIRLNYSYNDKSQTYKIPVHYTELDNIETLLEKAKSPVNAEGKFHKVEWEEWDAYDLHDKIIAATQKASYENSKYNNTRIVTCVQNMYTEGSIKGQSHNNLLRMLNAWRKNGLNYEQSFELAKKWVDDGWSDYEVNNQVNSVWKNAYTQYSCDDEVMAKYCDWNCIYYKAKNYNINIVDNMTIEQELKESLMEVDNPDNPTFDLNNLFDLGVECQFRTGNMILLFGHPKIGKSFWMQYVSQKAKKKTLYYTLEMPSTEIYQRQLMIALEENEKQVTERLTTYDEELHSHVDHMILIDSSPTLLDIESHIRQFDPEWVVVDTLDMISEDGYKGNETMRLTHIFQRLKQIAVDYKIVILIVQHITGSDAFEKDGTIKPLTMMSGAYSKDGSKKADKILGWEGYQNTTTRRLRSLALRRGKHFDKEIEYLEDYSQLIPIIKGK